MNCNECTSQKVCFLQKQVENLADKMVQPPFHEIIDAGGDRTASLISRHTRAVSKQFDVSHKLREVIASSCPLYSDKPKSKTDYEAIKINDQIKQFIEKEFSDLALEVKFDLKHPELHGIECRPCCIGTIQGASWEKRDEQQRKDFIKSKLVQILSSIRDMINDTIIGFGTYQDPSEDDEDRKIWNGYGESSSIGQSTGL